MLIDTEIKVGRLAAEHPLATRVLARYGIDYCCGGGRPLGEVCREKGLEPEAVIREIEQSLAGREGAGERWDEAPLGEIVDHILAVYHEPLHEELPRLEAMARRVAEVHGHRDDRLARILSAYRGLEAELEDHMAKEEQVLFPMIQQGYGTDTEGPIAVMRHEHDSAAAYLRLLRELTDGYQVPPDACNTWRALWHGLRDLEESLHRHIHLENEVLFPRALAG